MDTKSSSGSSTWSSPLEGWAVSQKRLSSDLSYMHRPPRIAPNYGRKYKEALRLKTKLPRVLLYDNVTEQTVLDVQLSGIVSQRSKAKRELELQKKSFILRKQFKDKALKKLTKVHHGKDYEQFELEYYGYLSEGNNDVDGSYTKLPKAGSLPDIRVTNGHASKNRKTMTKRRGNVRTNSDNALLTKSFEETDDSAPVVLPPIDDALLHAASYEVTNAENSLSEPKSAEPTSAHELNPTRRIGYSYDKGREGTTRIFHTMSRGNSDVTQDAIAAITNANQPDDTNEQLGIDTEQPTLTETNKPASVHEVGESTSAKVKTFNVSHPVLDIRFELLQKVLIRQDPPNEGFLELSPSFKRATPEKKKDLRGHEKHLDSTADTAHGDQSS
ncbi:uncharacterized protein LOC106070433 [Biomphalaria glabrata]|uniref:Uncharacterized protein LOC106070433 n=1 Tax=Biomphalaria glabrata TaxID=6526 RepID=A0A9W3BMZ7_BIOGL|nr:uncharacterized protein LOC106070433 [Biomphalaria glabrata]XP_055900845.1 uncharacterized protein LOC106070433 [Biomphalaria glabrata]XP_055900846.1 uncharacterized protein LOC106070433 [Biomphalaria glabrata]XP_055900847.1 uncharacterized protein LOC106070433 [Biomphalaria glabrata]XP_055900848.1 uncharacterized protein LOC106070433 [Biomphalaria glabrata]XP_055900849.1 uncharacterized protein LOC106070433 [Biomphalaria glabrata]XP_055900850.1 uncharacterized protein LOC106070433 [Biomph